MSRRSWRWLVAAPVALAAAWVLAPATVPIYDGIGQPDQPYRYVKAPAGYSNPSTPPSSATATVAVRGGQSGTAYANSKEIGPQVSVYFPAGALKVPAGATTISVGATPEAPSSPLPSDGTIVTNVYRVTATVGGAALAVIGTGNQAPTLQMRAPSAQQPGPVFEHRTASGWQRSQTARVGNDIYQTQASSLGEWALVQLADPGTGNGGGSGVNLVLLIPGVAILAVAGIIIAVRMSRSRRAA